MTKHLLIALLSLGLTACVSAADVDDAFRRVDRVWQLEYQKTEDEFRYRVIDAGYDVALVAVRRTFLDLGMPVQASNFDSGVIIAENAAPTPLSKEEWREVAKAENPRLKEIGSSLLVLSDDPKGYIVTVRATVRPFRGKTLVLLDYSLDAPTIRRLGIQPSRHAPPRAVQLASLKFWITLQKRLLEVKAPPPRRRLRHEIDA